MRKAFFVEDLEEMLEKVREPLYNKTATAVNDRGLLGFPGKVRKVRASQGRMPDNVRWR
ncbi:hypothetical protein IMSAGC011_01855 [Lachnospiraceae bacterium]|nr:hypothetical protein IMSAGC011_01855 [Lachnospiraceae bacterium]